MRVISAGGTATPGQSISPVDRGFLLGDAIFETLRVYRGRPFALDAHLDRLRRSAKHLRIPVPPTIQKEIDSVLEEGNAAGWGAGDCALRITLSRGLSSAPGLQFLPDAPATVGIVLLPISAPVVAEGEPLGLSAVFAAGRRNERAATAGHKTVNFVDSVLELARARDAGADDCVFLDSDGHLSECSTSNLFIVDGDSLATPALSCGALPGITRSVVIDLVRGGLKGGGPAAGQALRLRVQERVVEKEELILAREAFVTSSLRGVVPLIKVDSWTLGTGKPGEITRALTAAYEDRVRR